MRSNLLPSVATVFLFWWIVLGIAALFKGNIEWSSLFFTNILERLSLSGLAFLWGASITSLFLIGRRFFKKGELASDRRRGISVSLGPFPVMNEPLPRLPLEKPFPKRLDLWVTTHDQKSYKPHLDLLYAVAEMLEAHPLVPAGEMSDHGGRTLREHSYNVAEAILEVISDNFSYEGLYTVENGKRVYLYKPEDSLFQLLIHDPLIPLAGIAHDLGKLEAFQLDDMGQYQKTRNDHDHRGQMILSRLPEFWRLPEDDQQPLLDIVGFYHHWADLPVSSEERTRALIAALCKADNLAGSRESLNPVRISAEETYRLLQRTQDAKKSAGQSVRKLIKTRDEEVSPDEELPEGQELSKFHARLIEAFDALVIETNRINGTNSEKRLGVKKGKYLYLAEKKVIESVAERIGAPQLAVRRRSQTRENVISSNLLYVLNRRGILYRRHKGYEYPPEKAMFNLTLADERDVVVFSYKRVFVIKADAYPELRLHRDIQFKLKEMHAVNVVNAATNRGNPGPDNAPEDNAINPQATPAQDALATPAEGDPTSPQQDDAGTENHPGQGPGEIPPPDEDCPPPDLAAIDLPHAEEVAPPVVSDAPVEAALIQPPAVTPVEATQSGALIQPRTTEHGPGQDTEIVPLVASDSSEADAPAAALANTQSQEAELAIRFVEEATKGMSEKPKISRAKKRKMDLAQREQERFSEFGGAASAPLENLTDAEKHLLQAVRGGAVETITKVYDGKEYLLVNLDIYLETTSMTEQDRAAFIYILQTAKVVALIQGESGAYYARIPK
jgi:hypothetical protein